MTKDEKIKSLISEILQLLDLKGKNELIGYLEGLKFTLDGYKNAQ